MKRLSDTEEERFWKRARLEEQRRFQVNMKMKHENLKEIAREVNHVEDWIIASVNEYGEMYKAPFSHQMLFMQYMDRQSELYTAEMNHLMEEDYYYLIPKRLPIKVND